MQSRGFRHAYLVIIKGLGGLHDSLYDLGEVASVEEIVRLGRSGQQLFSYSSVNLNASLADLVP